jgi:hypothetical protein
VREIPFTKKTAYLRHKLQRKYEKPLKSQRFQWLWKRTMKMKARAAILGKGLKNWADP